MNELFDHRSLLFIHQLKEWAEIFTDFETKNKYEILDDQKNKLGFVIERSSGFMAVLRRVFLRSHRPLAIDVFGAGQNKILHLSRSFFFFFSDLSVSDGSRFVGSINRRFGILYKKYDLKDEMGKVFASIKSPIWRLWKFQVVDRTEQEVSVISKKWGGALREMFTDADTYMIDFQKAHWTTGQKAIILSAAISIDFDFFEDNQRN